ncbi:MAG: helix-turn-helix transcriptional regulator [Aggregatilineales bacterium]
MSLPHLILGLLSDQPMSGYDLNKAFHQSVQHFWTVDQSQIYRALYKLHEQGNVDVELIEQSDNPDKKVYHVTKAGEMMLEDWLKTPLAEPPVREGWLGQIHFADHIDDETLIENLLCYRQEMNDRYQVLSALRERILANVGDVEKIPRRYRLRLLTLDYGIEVHKFHLGWFDRAIGQIRKNTTRS